VVIIEYLRSCTAGSLGMSDCAPVWQLGIIAAFLVAAIVALVVLRLRRGAGALGEPAGGSRPRRQLV
jgi:hypothetical protein